MIKPDKFFIPVFLLIAFTIHSQEIIEKKDPRSFEIRAKCTIENNGLKLTKVILLFPVPRTNEYQEARLVDAGGGETLDIRQSNDKYLRFILQGNDLPHNGEKKVVSYVFRATVYSIKTDFQEITKIYPYNESSAFTGNNDLYIDTNNEEVMKISEKLRADSKDYLDYSRKCYEYVAKKYKYINPNTGFHTIGELISAGGGDCGNLSLIFVNLLRCRGIPARLLVARSPDNSTHAWADFYLENYGWIPVDVTFKNADMSGDYFGNIPNESNMIIMSKDVNLELEREKGDTVKINILQSYAYWYWCSSGSGELKTDFHFEPVKLK